MFSANQVCCTRGFLEFYTVYSLRQFTPHSPLFPPLKFLQLQLHIPLSCFWIEQDTSSPDTHRKRMVHICFIICSGQLQFVFETEMEQCPSQSKVVNVRCSMKCFFVSYGSVRSEGRF
ncbi:hypothetical protein HanHA300_Chr16g0616311 [Helianthus annuus]|nr:hypothetical protein HanHA300_Chr16g0616311 [Helianthus annuus]KAJ0460977.1 hypothetical protein HanHA89_Chr16g0667091 [Helianthus annuus]KAJ0641406.1 hypothetical protein HanLR1_Chr16g0626851 [Helianthus annuus]KAJ0645303.1 hypothetical protein HanOQP8_Chr16g0622381 [Helianthus annuus]